MFFVRISDQEVRWIDSYQGESYWKKTMTHDLPYWKKSITIVDARPRTPVQCIRQVTTHYNIPMLKSNIQKTFRRNVLSSCLSTVKQLLRQDPMEALRRLPVIFLEDGLLHHESFSLVVWLLAAYAKGYRLRTEDEMLILSAVTTACSATHRYSLYKETEEKKETDDQEIGPSGYSIALRSVFGGMKDDITFLLKLASRVDELEVLPSWLPTPHVNDFTMDHMIPESIDFHCCGTMIEWCKERTRMNHNAIQQAIWWHWSSINVRTITEDQSRVLYEESQRLQSKGNAMRLYTLVQMYSTIKIKWMNHNKKKVMVQSTLSFPLL